MIFSESSPRCTYPHEKSGLVHEKAVEFGDLTGDAIHVAQHEAKKAVSFVKKVAERLA
jgi:hypothetical protein